MKDAGKISKISIHGSSLTVNVTDLCNLLYLDRGDPVFVKLERIDGEGSVIVVYDGKVNKWDCKEDAIDYFLHKINENPETIVKILESLNQGNVVTWDGGKIPPGWEDKLQS